MAIDWKEMLFSYGTKGADIFTLLATIIFFGAIIFGLIMWIKYVRSFKHHIIIRVVTENRKRIFYDMFREYTDDDGVLWWKLKGRKHVIPVAPPEAIELTAGGAISVEAYYTPEGEYVFASDKVSKEHAKDINAITWIVDKPDKKYYNDAYKEFLVALSQWTALKWYQKIKSIFFRKWYVPSPSAPQLSGRWAYIRDNNKVIDSFQPLTTKQRLILVNQYKKAQDRKKNSFWQNLPQIASLTVMAVIVIVMVVFWEDITKPTIEAGKQNAAVAQANAEVTKMLHEIITERQTLGQDTGTRGLVGEPPK